MRVFVKAKPNAKERLVQKIDDSHYIVYVTEPPTGGKANLAITKAIAEYLGVTASRVNIVSGHTSKQKVIEIL